MGVSDTHLLRIHNAHQPDKHTAVNLLMKPASGLMQFFSMPMEGTAKDLRGLFRKEVGRERIATRYAQGVLDVKRASQSEREMVTNAFAAYKIQFQRERKGKGRAT